MAKPSTLVAGVGNVLRGDDGFGVEVARGLANEDEDAISAEGADVIETGIGGISLVQELMRGYDRLVIADAVDQGLAPGELVWQKLQVADIEDWAPQAKESFLADMHYANPGRALALAKALGVLPDEVYLMGCQASGDDFKVGMSEPVEAAVPEAVARIRAFLESEREPHREAQRRGGE